MPDKKEFIIFVLLCIISLGLGYWYGMPDKPSEERAEVSAPPAPTVVTNITANIVPVNLQNAIVEKAIRVELGNSGIELRKSNPNSRLPVELTKADLEKVTRLDLNDNKLTNVKALEKLTQLTRLYLRDNQLTDVKGLEELTQLEVLSLRSNQLTDVKGLEKLTQLTYLNLQNNPDLTKAQIDQLQKALPKCEIYHNATK